MFIHNIFQFFSGQTSFSSQLVNERHCRISSFYCSMIWFPHEHLAYQLLFSAPHLSNDFSNLTFSIDVTLLGFPYRLLFVFHSLKLKHLNALSILVWVPSNLLHMIFVSVQFSAPYGKTRGGSRTAATSCSSSSRSTSENPFNSESEELDLKFSFHFRFPNLV